MLLFNSIVLGKVSSFESWNENKFRNSKSNDFDFP